MNGENLQAAIERAEKYCDESNTLTVSLIELQRIDTTRGLRDQAEVDYWTERLNSLVDDVISWSE